MRKRDCVSNLDTQLVCARQMTMKCAYSSVAYRGRTVRHCTRVSRGQVDVKPRKQIIRNPRFEREMKLVRLELNSNSQYFAFLINSQSNNTGRAKALSMGGNCYNSSLWRDSFE